MTWPERVAPAPRRLVIRREGSALVLEHRGARQPILPVLLAAWLVAWFFGEREALVHLFSPDEDAAGAFFLLVWLAMWTAGGLGALALLVYSLAGREIVTLRERTLTLRWAAGPLGWSRRFEVGALSNLRFEELSPLTVPDESEDTPVARRRIRMPPALAFDRGGTTVRFASRISREEAALALAALGERIPLASRDAGAVPR